MKIQFEDFIYNQVKCDIKIITSQLYKFELYLDKLKLVSLNELYLEGTNSIKYKIKVHSNQDPT